MLKSRIMLGIWIVFCMFYYVMSESGASLLLLGGTLLLCIYLAVEAAVSGKFVQCQLSEIADGRKGQPVRGCLNVKSRFILPIAKMSVFFSFWNVMTGEKQQCRASISLKARGAEQLCWEFYSEHCGKVQLKIDKIIYYDFLGVFRRKTYPGLKQSYLILPETFPAILDISSRNAANMDSDLYSDTRKGYDSSETFNIREYIPGDHTKFIHWKLSSKMDQVLIRELGFPIQNSIHLFLETSTEEELLDFACIDTMLEIFVSFSHALCRQNYDHTLVWYSAGEDSLKEYYIQEESDISDLMEGLLSTPFQPGAESVISKYLAQRNDISAAHIVYVTDSFHEEELLSLAQSSCVTVLKNGSFDEEEGRSDTAFTVIPYEVGSPEQELCELSI